MAPQTPYGASWRHFLALMAKKGDAPFFIWQKQEMAPYGVKRRNGAMWRNRHIWHHAAPYDACAIFYGAIWRLCHILWRPMANTPYGAMWRLRHKYGAIAI